MEGVIFSEDLCRLCLWRSNKLLPIFSEEGELQGIPGKICLCLPISVSREDFLPKLICSRCIYKLEMFSEFRNSCLRSEELLKRYAVPENPLPTQIQQVEPCQPTIIVQAEQQDVKLEVSETESVAVVQETPAFMCLIHEPAIMMRTEMQASEQTHTPIIESVNSISTDFLIQNTSGPAAGKKRKVTKSSSSGEPMVEKTNANTTEKARRNIHSCKHCSKNFPSRLQLSRHLTSSNCLFRYTCRYCAKIFVTAENRLQHEKNHKDKKNFICGICKQVFQSSFELNVHAVQGCERPMLNSPQPKKKTNKKKPGNKVTSSQTQKSLSENPNSSSQSGVYSCLVCSKVYRKNVHFQKHLRNCKKAARMLKMQETRRKNRLLKQGQKVISGEIESCKVGEVQSQNTRTRKPSRRKQTLVPLQDTPVADNPNISPKASLLAVLGLKEKPNLPKQEPEMETEMNTGRCSPDVIVVEEIVTVCDICRKIFTSEAGMLNHQTTVHNRNLTAEKIHTLMRVEI